MHNGGIRTDSHLQSELCTHAESEGERCSSFLPVLLSNEKVRNGVKRHDHVVVSEGVMTGLKKTPPTKNPTPPHFPSPVWGSLAWVLPCLEVGRLAPNLVQGLLKYFKKQDQRRNTAILHITGQCIVCSCH